MRQKSLQPGLVLRFRLQNSSLITTESNTTIHKLGGPMRMAEYPVTNASCASPIRNLRVKYIGTESRIPRIGQIFRVARVFEGWSMVRNDEYRASWIRSSNTLHACSKPF